MTKAAEKNNPQKDVHIQRAQEVLTANRLSHAPLLKDYSNLLEAYQGLFHKFNRVISISDKYQGQLKEKAIQLNKALAQLKQLKEIILPICMYCKKIRTDSNYWEKIESYFSRQSDVLFSHSICPECVKEKFGEGPERSHRLKQALNLINRQESGRKTQNVSPEDPVLTAMKALLEDSAVKQNPLQDHLRKFADKYAKLLSRLNKILIISDSYQAQLHDLNLRLEMVARTDMMTGLSNRWDMIEKLETEKSRAERHGKAFSIIMMDIDQFKRINDHYGHEMGDRSLIEMARLLKQNLRKEDGCARWGGEEFLLLLPETDSKTAVTVGQKLIETVRGSIIEHPDNPIRLTVSLGICTFQRNQTIDECIRSADQALYEAKAAGRNRLAVRQ